MTKCQKHRLRPTFLPPPAGVISQTLPLVWVTNILVGQGSHIFEVESGPQLLR